MVASLGLFMHLWTDVGPLRLIGLSWAIIPVSQGFSATRSLAQAHSQGGRRSPTEKEFKHFLGLSLHLLTSHRPKWSHDWGQRHHVRLLKVMQQGGMDWNKARICGPSWNLPLQPFHTAPEHHLAHSKHTGQIKVFQMNNKVRTRKEQGRIQAEETLVAKAPR